MIEVIYPAFAVAFTAAVYGGYAYLSGRIGTPGEPFEFQKLVGTVIVGAGVGIIASYMGMPLTEASAIGIFTSIGAVEVGQKTVKLVLGAWKRLMEIISPNL